MENNKCEKCGIEISNCESKISYDRCSYRLCNEHEIEAMKLLEEFVKGQENEQ